jgi:hypothetical protein
MKQAEVESLTIPPGDSLTATDSKLKIDIMVSVSRECASELNKWVAN